MRIALTFRFPCNLWVPLHVYVAFYLAHLFPITVIVFFGAFLVVCVCVCFTLGELLSTFRPDIVWKPRGLWHKEVVTMHQPITNHAHSKHVLFHSYISQTSGIGSYNSHGIMTSLLGGPRAGREKGTDNSAPWTVAHETQPWSPEESPRSQTWHPKTVMVKLLGPVCQN